MFLKSMEIFGFKSFADRTNILFEQGITVIVGPNGCGKSNIVDSAKWVLGEKQAKNIRGDKMEDVIFTGTEHRKPLSLAEVSLTIDNSQRVLNFDSESVTVTRRVFRDGESEYLINKSPVRLKDIDQLFMDTGIGKSSYSVMEQGRIDMILSSRAEDRRYIFEEAAGISRFKVQKRESLKKLEDTGENLERINDIIHEIEREKDLKAKQAEKTKTYLKLKAELEKNDIRLSALKFRDLAKRLEKLKMNRDKLHSESADISTRISSISRENDEDEKLKNEIQLALLELEKKIHTYRIRVEDIDDKREKNRAMIAENREHRERLVAEIDERRRHYATIIAEKERLTKSGVEIAAKIEEDRRQLKNFFDLRKRKIETIHANRDRIEGNKASIHDREAELKRLRDDLEKVIKELIEAIDARKEELRESENDRARVRSGIHERLDHLGKVLSEIEKVLHSGDSGRVEELISSIEYNALVEEFKRFETFEDGFRSLLFDEGGVHAKKEHIDGEIAARTELIENLRKENGSLDEQISTLQSELDDVNEMITRIEKDLSRNDNEKEWIEKHVQTLDRQIADIVRNIENVQNDIRRSEEKVEALQKEIKEWEDRLIEFNERTENLRKRIEESTARRNEIEKKMLSRRESSHKDTAQLQEINDRITDAEKKIVEAEFKLSQVTEYVWIEYEKKSDELERIKVDEIELDSIQSTIQKVKSQIQSLGPINNLAIEEFNDLKKRFDYYIAQKEDIEKAREDILAVIADINKTSVELFLETFEKIRVNFAEIFRQLFEGGNAEIELSEPEAMLESGIEITVRPPGKKPKSISLLSGGERTMTAIALLFATYMVKPSPFCFLDEIDAALDEENVGRFLKMMKQFSQKTQFVMITHNKKTMSIGSSIYGITMEEAGISKIVSMKLERSPALNRQQETQQ